MTTVDEVVDALRGARDPAERRLHFAAILASAAAVPVDDFIVVGGSAIEFYTVGECTTGDIGVVSREKGKLRAVLRGWGFRREGRVWFHEELGVVVDLVRHPYTGDVTRTQILRTPHGSIRIAAIEDLLVKRLASAKHWGAEGDFGHARLLATLYRERIDWDYVERLASEYDVRDVLASLRRAVSRS